jgi:uncharacterized membrane protein HdeD (DUF308 family)
MEGSSVLIVRGIVAIAFGIIAFLWPGITIAALVLLFGGYAIVDGITNVVLGFSRAGEHHRWAYVLMGLVGIAAGVLTFAWPAITGLALVWLIAGWAFAMGIIELVAAIKLRHLISGEWLLVLSAIAAILVGIFIAAYPGAGAVAIAWMLGAYALATGIMLISLGAQLKSRFVTA